MYGYDGYGYNDYDSYGRGSHSSRSSVNVELQSQLEIKIKARTSSSQKLEFTFKPSMFVSSSLTRSAASSIYGSSSRSRGRSHNTIYLPITHLVSKVFPKYVKQYKLTLPASSSLIFIDEAEYQRYINYANGLIYPDEDASAGKKQPSSASQPTTSIYVIDDDVEMINQNISFIVNKLFNENRVISNITGRPELGSGSGLGLGPGYGTGTGSQPDRVNQEYYIETFFMPSPMPSQNKQIYTDASVKIAEYLKSEKDLLAKIDDDKQKLKQQQSVQQERTKLTIGIARNEMKRQKLISQRVAYEYGQATNYNLQQLKTKEKKLTTDIIETNRIIDTMRDVGHDRDRMHHDKEYYKQRLAQYKRELEETKSILESMKLRMYLITITDMVLIPKILNNGKENPQFAVLYNQFISRDRTLGADAGRIGVGEESSLFMPSRAKCGADKKAIESMYDEIVRNTVSAVRHEMSDTSAPIGSEAISRATTKTSPDEPGMIEEMKTAWMNMGKNNSAEYFEKNPLDRASAEDVFRATLEHDGASAETANKAAMALIRTRMGAYPVFFTLFGTPKLYRPDGSASTTTSSDIVNVVREPHRSKQDGGMKMKIQGLGLILNPTTVPPHFFTLKGDPAEYNKFKTVEIPYTNVKIMDFTGMVDTAATPAVLVVPATPDADLIGPVSTVPLHVPGTDVADAIPHLPVPALANAVPNAPTDSDDTNRCSGVKLTKIHTISSDGNCFYSAVDNCLKTHPCIEDIRKLSNIDNLNWRQIVVEHGKDEIKTAVEGYRSLFNAMGDNTIEDINKDPSNVIYDSVPRWIIPLIIEIRNRKGTAQNGLIEGGDTEIITKYKEKILLPGEYVVETEILIVKKYLLNKFKTQLEIKQFAAYNQSDKRLDFGTRDNYTIYILQNGRHYDSLVPDTTEISSPSSGGSSTLSTKTRQVKINHKLKNNGTRRRRK